MDDATYSLMDRLRRRDRDLADAIALIEWLYEHRHVMSYCDLIEEYKDRLYELQRRLEP